jgi:hypothetical protein
MESTERAGKVQRRDGRNRMEQHQAPVDLESVKLSWSLLKIGGALLTGIGFVIYVTITINSFLFQTETFRLTVTVQISQLNENIQLLVKQMREETISLRDLSEFCSGLQQENTGIGFRCPPAYQYIRRSQQEKGWSPQ